jgi:hypothetical protein
MVLRRIGVFSMGRFLACFQGLVGLLVGTVIALISLAAGAPKEGGGAANWLLGLGILAMVLVPIIYAVIGFVSGVIGALLFNLVASISGGIEVELFPGGGRDAWKEAQ